jgi:hypothetical protein
MKLMGNFHELVESKSITFGILLNVIDGFAKKWVFSAFALALLFKNSN